MAVPNMATITASLERSLRNCSLNHHNTSSSSSGGVGPAHGSNPPENIPLEDTTPTLDLNSQNSLPYNWEQCLDLKTGEIYYINWRTGMKASEDPRTTAVFGGDYYSDDDSSSYGSEESSSESTPFSRWSNTQENCSYYQDKIQKEENIIFNNNNNNDNNIINDNSSSSNYNNNNNNNNSVLVVAGCKSCLMYYMVPKQLEICPKCCGQLLHFDRSENGSP